MYRYRQASSQQTCPLFPLQRWVFSWSCWVALHLFIWLRWVFRCCAVFLHLWRGYSLVVVCGLYIAVASLVVEHGLSGVQTSTAAAHRLGSCGLMGPGVSRLQSLQQVGSAVAAHRL